MRIRKLGLLMTLVLLVALLVACGNSGNAGNAGTADNAGTAGNAGSTGNGQSSDEQEPANGAAEQQEQRIVSTTVAITEVLNALELDVVGVPTTAKTLPERYSSAVAVGNPMGPDMEIVKSLKPSHVFSVTTLEYDLGKLFENAAIDASFLDFTSLASMKEEILRLGEMFDRVPQAEALNASYDQKIADIKAKVDQQQASPSVLILMGIPGSYLVATDQSYIGDLVKQLGGSNIVTDSSVEFVSSNTEYLYQSNPDVILRAAHGMPEEVIQMFDEEFKSNDIWKHFNAVKNERVYDLPEDFFGTTGNLAADEALEILAPMLYPELEG